MFYTNQKANVTIHNLTNLQIPKAVLLAMSLGLKFNFNRKPNIKLILSTVSEGIRKLAWKTFFINRGDKAVDNKTTKILIKIKKSVGGNKLRCPLENVLFRNSFLSKCKRDITRLLSKGNPVHEYLLGELSTFVQANNITIVESDKNAGLVIMNTGDYKSEIVRQLDDLNTYTPSTLVHYGREMQVFQDKARNISNLMFGSFKFKINQLVPKTFTPAKFYLLPKIHKAFTTIPVGRPICSNVKTINRGFSILLDEILRPLTLFIPTLIIDTPHLLWLLHNTKLDPSRKYCLITADIQSMYQELPIQVCKENCMQFFNKYKNVANLPFEVTQNQIKSLLHLCLDYSFIQYENQVYFQKRGIQMGNNASVSIANLTADIQLENIWKPEMVFKGRFIDDLICILDTTDINISIEEWLQTNFKHPFLKFTYDFSFEKVNFLDLTISISHNNLIKTTLYQKEMSKHEYLHYHSNHPIHMLKSLPFSCGLRVIRSCSEELDRDKALENMFNKFSRRLYPKKLLEETNIKLMTLDRLQLIKPKSEFHMKHLKLHTNFQDNVNPTNNNNNLLRNGENVFIVLPFYNFPLRQITTFNINAALNSCISERLKSIALGINVQYAFTIPDQFRKIMSVIENNKAKQS